MCGQLAQDGLNSEINRKGLAPAVVEVRLMMTAIIKVSLLRHLARPPPKLLNVMHSLLGIPVQGFESVPLCVPLDAVGTMFNDSVTGPNATGDVIGEDCKRPEGQAWDLTEAPCSSHPGYTTT